MYGVQLLVVQLLLQMYRMQFLAVEITPPNVQNAILSITPLKVESATLGCQVTASNIQGTTLDCQITPSDI